MERLFTAFSLRQIIFYLTWNFARLCLWALYRLMQRKINYCADFRTRAFGCLAQQWPLSPPKTRVGPGIRTSDLPIPSSLLCDHKTEHPHCCERVDPCVHTFSITASPALRACRGLLEPIQVWREGQGYTLDTLTSLLQGHVEKQPTVRMRASELPICYVPWKSLSKRKTTTLQNATQETQEVKFVGGETQEINCEWDA